MSVSDDVARELAHGRSPDEVMEMLVKRGLSEATARRFVERAQLPPSPSAAPARAAASPTRSKPATEDDGKRKMATGAFFCLLGLSLTVFSLLMARPGGKYTLAWGAVVYGLIEIGRGFAAWWKVRDSRPFPAMPVAVAALLPLLFVTVLYVFVRPSAADREKWANEEIHDALRQELAKRGIRPAPATMPVNSLDSAIAALRNSGSEARRQAIQHLKRMGAEARPAAPSLLTCLASRDKYLRADAAEALAAIDPNGPETLAALNEMLQDPDLETRIRTAAALAKAGEKAGVTLLATELESSEVNARRMAAGRLFEVGVMGTSVVPALLKHLKEDEDATVRGECARALGRIDLGTSVVMEALKAATEDPDATVQQSARGSLGDLEGRRMLAAIPKVEPSP